MNYAVMQPKDPAKDWRGYQVVDGWQGATPQDLEERYGALYYQGFESRDQAVQCRDKLNRQTT
jgi:hypothetical protein